MHRSLFSALLAAALLTASVRAQTYTTTYTAGSEIKATAYSNIGNQIRTAPKGTDLKRGFGLTASVSNGRASLTATYAESTKNGITIVIKDDASARYVSNSNRSSTFTGSHDTLLTIKSTTPARGTVYIDYVATLRNGARGGGAVDVGDDANFEFNATALSRATSVRATVTNAGLAIRTRTYSAASGSTTYRSPSAQLKLTVRFVKDVDPCVFTIYGKYCKPLLVGRNTVTGEIVLTTGSAVPSSPYVLMVGTSPTSLPLRINSCYLHTVPVLSLNGVTDYSGSGTWTVPIPNSRPSRLFMQGVTFDLSALTLYTTNGLQIDC